MTQRRERKEERKSRDLRRFKDSRTLREREEDAEECPKGGCSKSRGDEGELRRLAGWLCQSTSMYLAEECKRGAKVTFLTVDGRGRIVHLRDSRCGNYGRDCRTYGTRVFPIASEKIYILYYSTKPRSSFGNFTRTIGHARRFWVYLIKKGIKDRFGIKCINSRINNLSN